MFAYDTSYQEPHMFGDFNDPRRPDFAQARSGRSLRTSHIYGAQSPRSPHRGVNEEESDDELDGITPAQHLRVSGFRDYMSWVRFADGTPRRTFTVEIPCIQQIQTSSGGLNYTPLEGKGSRLQQLLV